VDFTLDEEQLGLQSAVRDLIAAHADLSVVRTSSKIQMGTATRPPLVADGAQGWPAVLIPPEQGGLGSACSRPR
jgi:hypothetical protein